MLNFEKIILCLIGQGCDTMISMECVYYSVCDISVMLCPPLTATVPVSEVRKSPHIPQSDCVADSRQNKVKFACPVAALLYLENIVVST